MLKRWFILAFVFALGIGAYSVLMDERVEGEHEGVSDPEPTDVWVVGLIHLDYESILPGISTLTDYSIDIEYFSPVVVERPVKTGDLTWEFVKRDEDGIDVVGLLDEYVVSWYAVRQLQEDESGIVVELAHALEDIRIVNEQNPTLLFAGQPPPAAFDIHIGLYGGTGTWDVNVDAIASFCEYYDIDTTILTTSDLSETDLSTFDFIWFPGGFSAQYRLGITDHDRIAQYVADGGRFVGICAGAYYAAETMIWHDSETDYPLNLFAGVAKGPLGYAGIGWGAYAPLKLTDHPANSDTETSINAYYLDGPYFLPDGNGIDVIATYGVNSKPAIISFSYGQGRVLLLGPHPELGYDEQSDVFTTDGSSGAQWPWLLRLIQSLF